MAGFDGNSTSYTSMTSGFLWFATDADIVWTTSMQRAVFITKTMAKCLMALASLGSSHGAKLVSSLRTYCVVRPRIYFKSTRKTGIEG